MLLRESAKAAVADVVQRSAGLIDARFKAGAIRRRNESFCCWRACLLLRFALCGPS